MAHTLGYSAKYGTYTRVFRQIWHIHYYRAKTQKILDFQVVHVGEVSNSAAMEKAGLERCLQYLIPLGFNIQQLATDRQTSSDH
jgi:hypothetical protein